jgi:hypothetical protein
VHGRGMEVAARDRHYGRLAGEENRASWLRHTVKAARIGSGDSSVRARDKNKSR